MLKIKMSLLILFPIIFTTLIYNVEVIGHGMMLEPVSRGSRWRFNSSSIADYEDNQGYCGGFTVRIYFIKEDKIPKINFRFNGMSTLVNVVYVVTITN